MVVEVASFGQIVKERVELSRSRRLFDDFESFGKRGGVSAGAGERE
jgi:hypothetical protein